MNSGTTFTLLIPRSLASTEPAAFELDEPAAAENHDATILVAEDNDQVRAYVVEVLRELGYRVLEAHDGLAALRLLERPDVLVDLLFSDLVMPGMAGWELAQRALPAHPYLRVLFTSGYPRNIEGNAQTAREVGILAKPFTRSQLAAGAGTAGSAPLS